MEINCQKGNILHVMFLQFPGWLLNISKIEINAFWQVFVRGIRNKVNLDRINIIRSGLQWIRVLKFTLKKNACKWFSVMIISGLNKLTITKNRLSLRSSWFKSIDVIIGSAALRVAFGREHCREFQSEILMNITNIEELWVQPQKRVEVKRLSRFHRFFWQKRWSKNLFFVTYLKIGNSLDNTMTSLKSLFSSVVWILIV